MQKQWEHTNIILLLWSLTTEKPVPQEKQNHKSNTINQNPPLKAKIHIQKNTLGKHGTPEVKLTYFYAVPKTSIKFPKQEN